MTKHFFSLLAGAALTGAAPPEAAIRDRILPPAVQPGKPVMPFVKVSAPVIACGTCA